MRHWIPRRAQKRDTVEDDIVCALKAIGASVHREGPLDLVVGFRGTTTLLEVKSAPSSRLTDAQADFLARHLGRATVVRTPEEALQAVEARVE